MTKKETRILIAPDKFKGALSAREVAENIAVGIRAVWSDAKLDLLPMADGGEGTAQAIADALDGSWMKCKAHDPLGREIEARYVWIEKEKLAVIEMSEAAGMWRLSSDELDPENANTFGVGELISDAVKRGAREIIVGLGGSATNDGGLGMARAIGFRFYQPDGQEIDNVLDLISLARIEAPPKLVLPKIIAAADVTNPLVGENGSTRIFGPQKGVTPAKIDAFERALTKFSEIVSSTFGFNYRDDPGAGAAGGLGFGLTSFCQAKIRSGFELVAELTALESKMKEAYLIITGEGRLDAQTLSGKTPFGVAQLARKLGKRIIAVVGQASDDRSASAAFDDVYVVSDPRASESENMARAAELLQATGRKLAQLLNISDLRTSNRT